MTTKTLARIATIAALSSIAMVYSVPKAVAQTCTTQYGGGTTCTTTDLSINKQVQYPGNASVFVENLTSTDPAYAANQEVLYRLVIQNNTGRTLTNVTVKDVLPPYLTFVSGPGTYNRPGAGGGTLTFVIDNLATGQTVVQVLTRVVSTLPFDRSCQPTDTENTATITSDNLTDEDKTVICISRAYEAGTLPVAGFNDLALLLPFAGMGLGGVALLRKKS